MSLRTVHVPQGLANDLWLWKQECPDVSADAFIFPNVRKRNGATKNGFIRTDNYRARVLKKLGEELGLKKLNFQVLRRTIATLAQTKGSVKDVQGVLGHSKPDITANSTCNRSSQAAGRRSMRSTRSWLRSRKWRQSRELCGRFGTFWYGGRFETACK
jgi:integrase